MREIKFRGFDDLTGNGWVYGDFSHGYYGNECLVDEIIVDEKTVGQFTGLSDVDGREIYEGDIVKATLKEPSFVKRFKLQNEIVGEMLFDNAWWIKERETVNLIPPWRLRYYDLTVIGNIHDNPDLLEKQP